MADPDAYPHDVSPDIWTREGVNRFSRADQAEICSIGRGQWVASLKRGPALEHVATQRGAVRKFPSAGATARFLALHHPLRGPSA